MKNLFYLLTLLCVLAVGTLATDVTVQPAQIPGFVGSNLPPIVTTDPTGQPLRLLATNGGNVLTCNNCLQQAWVNIGGFTIGIGGVNYEVEAVPNRHVVKLRTPYSGVSGLVNVTWYSWVQLRVYAKSAFTPAGEVVPQQPGAPGSQNWVRRYAVSIISDGASAKAHLPTITLPATTNAHLGASKARYYAAFYTNNDAKVSEYVGFDDFCVSPTINPATWLQVQTGSCAVTGTPVPTPVPTPPLNVLSVLNTFYPATDSGVQCDNVTDDTAAMEAARQAARAQNKTLLWPKGICRVSRVYFEDRDNILGAGIGKTIIRGIANEPVVTVPTTAFNARLEGFTIDGNSTFANQIGLNLEGSADYWGLAVHHVWVDTVGSHGVYIGRHPFSLDPYDIHVNNVRGYPVLVDSPIAPGVTLRNFYVHALDPAGLKIGYRIKRGRITCENCNGMDNVPSLQGSRYAVLGKRAHKGGGDTYPDTGDTEAGEAFVNWINTNFEAYESVGVDHYYFSRSTFDGEIRFAYINSTAGNNPNRIGLRYEIDETLGLAFAAYLPRGKMTATAVIGQPESDYKNGRFIHANNVPPLEIEGIGGAVAPASPPLSSYYDTEFSRSYPLWRGDGRAERITVTGSIDLKRPTIRYIEVNCSAAPCNVQLPWPGWYRRQETLTITDIAGTGGTIPIVLTANAQAKINGQNNLDIRRNRGTVVLMPYEADTVTGVEWRIVSEYAGGLPATVSTSGDSNVDFFARWMDARGKLALSSALFQSGNDIALNGGNLVFVKSGNTVTISPGTPTGSFAFTLPNSLPPATRCLQITSTGQFQYASDVCGSGGGGGSGTVTSVGLAANGVFNVTASPVTTTGTINLDFAGGQSPDQVLATPAGAIGAFAPRSLGVSHIPQLPLSKLNISGTPNGTRMLRDDGSWADVAPVNLPVRSIATAYTLDPAVDGIVFADLTAGSYTVTLPSPSSGQRRSFVFKIITSNGNGLTLAPTSGVQIDNQISHTISGVIGSAGQAVTVVFDGVKWWVL